MELVYSSKKLELQCTSLKEAKKLFGGDRIMAEKLLSRINSLKAADTINDIIQLPNLHFHNLKNIGKRDLSGNFAIDVKTRREKWRIILEPLDDSRKPYKPCVIDVISKCVRIVRIVEVSEHYE